MKAFLFALWALVCPLDAAAQSALERYEAGDYSGAARVGRQELASAEGAKSDELRMAVANSFAWTGDYENAVAEYQRLLGTRYDADARVGLANVLRWRGQANLAEPYYRDVLRQNPDHAEAKLGQELGRRDLRPALTARVTRTEDNQGATLDEVGLAYRYWTRDLAARWDVGVLGGRFETPEGNFSPRGLQASLWLPQMRLSPKLEAFAYDNGAADTRLFGALTLEPVRDRLRLRFGRVDWGRQAFTGSATRDGLTAEVLGLVADVPSALGSVRARLDAYRVSDSNHVVDGEGTIVPAWQPLPGKIKWQAGVTGRRAERPDPRYWSPNPAYGVAFLGVERGWYLDRLDVTASLRRTFAFTETAADGWSVGLNARYWIARTLALGVEAWAVNAPRPTPYDLHQVSAFVQQLW